MKVRAVFCLLAAFLLLTFCLGGCANKPTEEAVDLEGNGFTTSYHPYMWTSIGTSATDLTAESTFNHNEVDAFFAAIRISAEATKHEGITSPEGMEGLLNTYVANYSGTDEKITAADTEKEYVRLLVFEYDNTEMEQKYAYTAKLVMEKDTGEMLAILAAYPAKSDRMVKDEVQLIMDNAIMRDMAEAPGVSSAITQ